MPIPMPPSFTQYCKKFSNLLPTTMFNMRDIPINKFAGKYQYGDTNIPGTLKGKIELKYVLKSFPMQHSNEKYQLFVIGRDGIFAEETTHSERDEPIVFRNIFLRWFKYFGPTGYLVINVPDTRQLLFLSEVRYQEQINNKFVSNVYNYLDISESDRKKVRSHMIYVTGKETKSPIGLEYDENLYIALKNGLSYIHIREDNYVQWNNIKTYHPRY